MADTTFCTKKFLLNALRVFVITYVIAFIVVGIVWDPNGVNLFERHIGNIILIIVSGLALCLPMGASSFIASHPLPLTMGLCFFACTIVGFMGIKEVTGRRLLYVLLSSLTILGVIEFCLMA